MRVESHFSEQGQKNAMEEQDQTFDINKCHRCLFINYDNDKKK